MEYVGLETVITQAPIADESQQELSMILRVALAFTKRDPQPLKYLIGQ
jgi:hypothetical protein